MHIHTTHYLLTHKTTNYTFSRLGGPHSTWLFFADGVPLKTQKGHRDLWNSTIKLAGNSFTYFSKLSQMIFLQIAIFCWPLWSAIVQFVCLVQFDTTRTHSFSFGYVGNVCKTDTQNGYTSRQLFEKKYQGCQTVEALSSVRKIG